MIKTVRISMLTAGALVLSAGAGLKSADALEHVQLGQWYNLHTQPIGTCPGIDWHVVVDADREIAGFVAWDRMKHSAKLSGTLNGDDTFQIAAAEIGGDRKANIVGNVTSRGAFFTIDGTGTGCDKQSFNVEGAVYPTGGGGG